MSPDLAEAVRLLGAYTAGWFTPWTLAGPRKASCRAHIMSVLVGERVPQGRAGVNALREELYRQAGVAGECAAEREDGLVAFCKAVAA